MHVKNFRRLLLSSPEPYWHPGKEGSCDANSCSRRRPLGEKTLAVSVRHYDGTLEYDAHNLYPLFQAVATAQALQRLRGKRSFILSRRAMQILLPGANMAVLSANNLGFSLWKIGQCRVVSNLAKLTYGV